MSLLANVLGFSAFGFGARCFQLGLQKRGMFDAPAGHLIAAAAFGMVGWGVYEAEGVQNKLLEERRQVLLENRQREQADYLAKAT